MLNINDIMIVILLNWGVVFNMTAFAFIAMTYSHLSFFLFSQKCAPRLSTLFDMQKHWFKIRLYPHIGLPLTLGDASKVISYITNPKNIESHSFCPFIHTRITTSKFRKQYDDNGTLLYNGKRKHTKPKVRNIYYANHWDANIFAYYSYILSEYYENTLKNKGLCDVVSAYRRISKNTKSNKCNIDFAQDVFEYIRQQSQKDNDDLVAISFDIQGFFDNLDHAILKNAWKQILGLNEHDLLPKDHYQIFKAITHFSYVELNELFNLFQHNIIIKNKSGKIRKKQIKKKQYLKDQNAIAFCELKDLHIIRKNGLIKKDLNNGICQGSSISATLANIYMLAFDEYINQEILKIGGLYRRYSDDMVVVCSLDYRYKIIDLFENAIKNIAKLSIQDKKTQIFHFRKQNNQLICLQEFNGNINHNSHKRKFEYLGFAFDGRYTYLKPAALANYYRKMKAGVRRCKFYANSINNDTRGTIFQNRLHKQYSYIGASIRYSYTRKYGTTNQWIQSRKNWGNFISYAKKASYTLNDNKIKNQIKNHWNNLNAEIKG